jgi:hypothetical protein
MAIERITGKIVSAKLLDAFVVELFAAAGSIQRALPLWRGLSSMHRRAASILTA